MYKGIRKIYLSFSYEIMYKGDKVGKYESSKNQSITKLSLNSQKNRSIIKKTNTKGYQGRHERTWLFLFG